MGAAAYRRGSASIAREAAARAVEVSPRVERQALRDQVDHLRLTIERLEHNLQRARRVIAAERFARDKRVGELKADLQSADFAITTLCRIAFGVAQ